MVNPNKTLDVTPKRIVPLTSVSINLLPGLIRSFKELHPGIDFEILHGNYAEIEALLLEGSTDIAFLRAPVKPAFDSVLFYDDRVIALLPEDHPLSKKKSLSPQELADEPFIMLDVGDDNEFRKYFKTKGLAPDIHYTAREDAVVLAMVESGLGISLGYDLAFKRNPYHVVSVELEIPARREIHIATRKGQQKTLAVQAFLDFVVS